MGPLPHLRDFAGCAAGPAQLLTHGGFDGQSDVSTMYVCSVHRLDNEPSFSASWRAVEPRNQPPPPRSCHTACCDLAGRTVLLFGGYCGGLVSEVWAFSFDNNEWWQPETLGEKTFLSSTRESVL